MNLSETLRGDASSLVHSLKRLQQSGLAQVQRRSLQVNLDLPVGSQEPEELNHHLPLPRAHISPKLGSRVNGIFKAKGLDEIMQAECTDGHPQNSGVRKRMAQSTHNRT